MLSVTERTFNDWSDLQANIPGGSQVVRFYDRILRLKSQLDGDFPPFDGFGDTEPDGKCQLVPTVRLPVVGNCWSHSD